MPLPLLEDCCSPVVGQVITPAEAETLATSLKAVADPVGLSQPTVSHHLKVLVDAGIFTREQRGRWAYYRLVPDTLSSIARLLTTP